MLAPLTSLPSPDKNLLDAVRQGDEKAFALLFNYYKNAVYSIGMRFVENTAIAEEITQDVFLRVWKNKDSLPELNNFSAWLYTVARNRSITALQKKAADYQQKKDLFLKEMEGVAIMPETNTRELMEEFQEALSVLSAQQRKVFIMLRLEGYSREEVAEYLSLSPATVSVHLTLAIKKLKSLFARSPIPMSVYALVLLGLTTEL